MLCNALSADRDAEVCSSRGQTTCCSGAAERRLSEVAVDEADDIVSSLTSSLRTLVSNNAVLYRRKSSHCSPLEPRVYRNVSFFMC